MKNMCRVTNISVTQHSSQRNVRNLSIFLNILDACVIPVSARQPSVADLAIADLTITSQRNDDIDFTMPFMKLGKGARKNNYSTIILPPPPIPNPSYGNMKEENNNNKKKCAGLSM